SMVHDHVWGELRHWHALPNVEMVAAADPNKPLRDKVQAEYGVQKLYDSWQEMLEREDLHLLQVAATNADTAEIVEAAAVKGIHVISEKPMAARLSQADRMLAASRKHNTLLMINWPNGWSPDLLTMLRMIKDGAIGQPVYFKYRAAHNGPKEIGCSPYFYEWLYDEEKNGAGALMDYCCYSSNMNSYLFGLPKEVQGVRAVLAKDYPLPDDNAMIIMKYEKSFGVAEASWTQPVSYPSPNPICHGTGGCLYLWHGGLWIQTPKDAEARKVEPDTQPEYLVNGPRYLIHCLENNNPIEGLCSPEVSRNAQEILEAGLISADTGRTVKLPIEG
ncbi:MAG: Gfo/Idh/MocA family oxidoreductase, partial [Armatimonadota bacterium]|nr:Gfo/Idh/MocA family oxidoreductase [Armatimonadota bacterium]